MEHHSQSLEGETTTHSESQKTEAARDEELSRRYILVIDDLIQDAIKRGKHRLVVDALAWHLARFMAHHGAIAVGHILEKLGAHTSRIHQRAQAQAEANEARERGAKPN